MPQGHVSWDGVGANIEKVEVTQCCCKIVIYNSNIIIIIIIIIIYHSSADKYPRSINSLLFRPSCASLIIIILNYLLFVYIFT